MIKYAWEMKNNEAQNKIKESCERVMRSIERASAEGYSNTVFNPNHDYYEETKAVFKRHGYAFRPTGIVAGVRQTTEQICWFLDDEEE